MRIEKKDIEETQGAKVNYPMISDENLEIAKLYNMLPSEEVNDGKRTAMTNATVRSIFLIDPEKNQNDAYLSNDYWKKF